MVTVPGTPVRLITALVSAGIITAATDIVQVNKISISASVISQAGAGNTGNIYIGTPTMVKATLAGVVAVIAPGGSWGITNNVGMNVYEFQNWYVDADTANDAATGSIDQV